MSRFRTGARRARLLLALSLVAAAALATVGLSNGFASSTTHGNVTITVGVPRNFGYLSTLWARNIQPKGVTVKYKYFPVFTDMLTALNSGQIDLTEIGDVGAVQSYVNGGGKVQAVAVSQPNSLNCGLIVPKNSPVKTFAQLKGKKIIFLRSTNSYIGFLHQIKAAGLKESDFNIAEIAGPAANAAFTSGQADAYYTIDPNLADIVHNTGAREIATCKSINVQNVYPYVATTSAIKSKPKAIAAVIQAIANDFPWIKANPKKQSALLAPKLGFGEPAIRVTYARGAHGLQRVTPQWLAQEQKVINELVAAKIVAKPVKASQVFLSTFNADITPTTK